MKTSREEFFNTDMKQMIEQSYAELQRHLDNIIDKMGMIVFGSIEKELLEISRVSYRIGLLQSPVRINEENDFDEEDYECYEGVDNDD